MGIFQRYTKKSTNGKEIVDKKGQSKREGPWFVQYPHSRDPVTGKIRYRTEKASFNKKKAEAIFRAKSDAFQQKDKLGIRVDREITFSELIDWGLSQEIMKVKESASDDSARSMPLKEVLGEYKAVQITPLMADNFRIQMKRTISEHSKKTYSGSTINKMISLARRIYYLALDAGIVTGNPFARRNAFKEEPKGKYIPNDEIQIIREALPEYMKSVFITAYLTGMRRGEILDLEWRQVNLSGGFIDLSAEDTKTDEPRRIYFNSVSELKNVFIDAETKRLPGQKLVFTKPEGKPICKWTIQKQIKKICITSGFGPYRLHDLRHTFNTNMIKAGVDQVVIMKLTGHKTNKMFIRYSHLDKEQAEIAMGKLNTYLEKAG